MKKNLSLLMLIGDISIENVSDCDCAIPGTPQVEFEKADAVFVAKVVGINKKDNGKNLDYVEVVLNIIKSYKGISHPTMMIYTNESSMACGYNFEVGNDYLVYASEFEGELTTGLCDRTKEFSTDLEDLRFLDHVVETSAQ
jgi:hypothetical protein